MKVLEAVQGRLRLMIGRAIVSLVDDARKLQELQVDLLDEEQQDAVEHFQDYGFAMHPHPEAEAIVACAGGLRSHSIVIAVADRRYRLKNLKQGEVALYDDLGNLVKLGRTKLEVISKGDTSVTTTGKTDVTSQGDITVTTQGKATITASGEAKVKGSTVIVEGNVRLGGAGASRQVARVGDTVNLTTGVIIQGSSTVRSL